MKRTIIKEDTLTAFVEYDEDLKSLLVKGRSYPENSEYVYKDLFEMNLDIKEAHFKLDYMNTSSSKVFLEFIKNKLKECSIYWHYVYNDEEIKELGEIIETNTKKKFVYIIEDKSSFGKTEEQIRIEDEEEFEKFLEKVNSCDVYNKLY